MTSTPRAATPTPDIPQPTEERIAKRLEPWKVIAGIAAALVVAGVSFGAWQRDLATKADVEQERAGGAAAVEQLRAQTSDLRERLPVVERAVAELPLIRAQLFEIAKAVGARQVMPAPTAAQVPPP